MKIGLFIISLLGALNLGAQNYIDLVNVYYRISPSLETKSPEYNPSLEMAVVDFKLPIRLNPMNTLIVGGEYQHNKIRLPTPGGSFNFTSAGLQLGWEHKWNERSKMMFIQFTRLNTDFHDINVHHFQLGGLALGTTSRSKNFDWKYGLYYNAEYFSPMFVPLFGFNWAINDAWRFKLIVPLNFDLSYQPSPNFIGGLKFEGVNASYRINYASTLQNEYLDKADNNLWAYSEMHLGKKIWFHLRAGHSIIRKYRRYTENEKLNLKLGPVNMGDDRELTPTLFPNGWSFEARFIYRFPLS
jgi:hypothetical protein